MNKIINTIQIIKETILRITTILIALFYMTTNGITSALAIYGLYNFIPKIIKNYQEHAEAKLIFYIIISLILCKITFKCFNYFIMAVKTLISAITT